jgi:CRP-like cAMP-binding protein
MLIRQGAADNRLIFVIRGRLRVTRMGDGGRLRTLQLLGAGQCWCAAPVSGPGLSPVNVECLSDAEILTLHGEELAKLLSGSPAGAMGLAACLGDRLSASMKEMGDVSGSSVSRKLARSLCRLADSSMIPEASPATIEAITHEDLAALVGTVREVISRALSSFHKQGILDTGRGKIRILDLPRLRAIAAGDDPTSAR